MSKHTKGPWMVNDDGGVKYIENHDDLIARLFLESHYSTVEEFEANANLIASSPDLLEALDNLLEAIDFMSIAIPSLKLANAVKSANKAIAKAKAE